MHIYQIDAAVTKNLTVRRRDFLRCIPTAALAAGTLGWSDRLALSALAAGKTAAGKSHRACILLWMAGGPSPYETFSPLPGHENGGPTKAISTSVPGIQIAEHLPRIAGQMEEIALIRSLTSKEGNHNRASFLLHTGYLPTATVKYPALGAVAAAQLADSQDELPAFVRIGRAGRLRVGGGLLGSGYNPFVHQDPVRPPAHTEPTTNTDRYRRRLSLLRRLEEEYVQGEGAAEAAAHRKLYDKASRMILSPEMRAFDLSQEPERVRTAYGDSPFAAGYLLARRLVEAGVTFIEVNCQGWDTHKDNFTKTPELARQIDTPTAALIADLKQRGLLDSTLVVWMGEFGRTPKINPRGGRDHFPRAFCAALAGGGVRGGQVIGSINDAGTEVVDRPVTVPDLFQTYCRCLKIDAEQENTSSIGRPIKVVETGKPVHELF
jgi:hypothetical protein